MTCEGARLAIGTPDEPVEHVRSCPDCRAWRAELLAMRAALARVRLPQAPPEAHARLEAVLRRRPWGAAPRWIAVAAAALFALGLGSLVSSPHAASAAVEATVRFETARPVPVADAAAARLLLPGTPIPDPADGCRVEGCDPSGPPTVFYRAGNRRIGLILSADARLPGAPRCAVARVGNTSLLFCGGPSGTHIWVGRMEPRELERWAHRRPRAAPPAPSGVRLKFTAPG
jgi:hypothetical protein